jgi:hypothetical protein
MLIATVASASNKVSVFSNQTVKGVKKSCQLSWVSLVGGNKGCGCKRQMIQEIGELSNVIIFFDVARGLTQGVCCNRLNRRGDKFCITPVKELAIMSVFELDRELGLSHANDKSGVCIVFGARVYALHAVADVKHISR